MKVEYRKRKGVAYDSWHFCRNCSKDPKVNYDVRYTAPTDGELCDECKSKRARNDCQS